MSRPIRVLLEIHPHVLGGTERFLARLVSELDRRRWHPIVISPRRHAPLRLMAAAGIDTIASPHHFARADVPWIARLIERRGIDLVQSNYYSSCLAMAANLAGVRHIWRPGGHVRVGSGVRNDRDASTTINIIGALSDAIVCNSRFVAAQFRRARGMPPISVIPNGIGEFSRRRAPADTTPCRIGMVAHFTPQKRHEDFLRAAAIVGARHPDVEFVLVGGEYSQRKYASYAARTRRLATHLLGSRVRIIEDRGRDVDRSRDCDVLVLPSVGESCSNAVLEAMAAEVPVIAARSGGNSELIDHDKTGWLVRPEEPKALAAAMLRLLESPSLRARLGRNARRKARSTFSIRECAKRYERLWETCTEP